MAVGRRFELIRELGAGAFGTVYLANMVSGGDFRKRVALKLLNAQWDAGGDAGRRLRDEARLLGLLRHRAIVAVDDLVLLDGRWAVVMEHVPGADLERVLEALWKLKRAVPPPAAMEIVASTASALDAAWTGHPEGSAPLRVVHRDIKPSNIRLTPDGDVKVLDFGIARGDFEGREAKTEAVRYGSIGYMAPERVLGEEEGPEGDVYALGCVMVELLRGNALGRSALLPEQQEAQVSAALAEIEEKLGVDVAPALQLLREMLRYEISERPSAAQVAERARRLARTLQGQDLAEFARQAVPMVAAVLGDQGKEAQGALSEQLSDERDRKDAQTMATMVEGSSFDRLTGASPEPAPTAKDPSIRRGLWVGLGVGGLAAVALALFLFPERATPPVEPTPVASPAPTPPPAAAVATTPTPPADPGTTAQPPTSAPAPEEAASAPQAKPAREPRATSARATTPTAETPAPAPAAEAAASQGPTLRAVKFAAPLASSVRAACGGVRGNGTTSALLRDVPAGECTVEAVFDGKTHSARVSVSAPSGFTCALDGETFACR